MAGPTPSLLENLTALLLPHQPVVNAKDSEAWRLPDDLFLVGLLSKVCKSKESRDHFKRSCFKAFRLNEVTAAQCIQHSYRKSRRRRGGDAEQPAHAHGEAEAAVHVRAEPLPKAGLPATLRPLCLEQSAQGDAQQHEVPKAMLVTPEHEPLILEACGADHDEVRDAASRPDMADEMTKVAEEVAEEVNLESGVRPAESTPLAEPATSSDATLPATPLDATVPAASGHATPVPAKAVDATMPSTSVDAQENEAISQELHKLCSSMASAAVVAGAGAASQPTSPAQRSQPSEPAVLYRQNKVRPAELAIPAAGHVVVPPKEERSSAKTKVSTGAAPAASAGEAGSEALPPQRPQQVEEDRSVAASSPAGDGRGSSIQSGSTLPSPTGGLKGGRCQGVRGANPYRRKWNPRLAAVHRREQEEAKQAKAKLAELSREKQKLPPVLLTDEDLVAEDVEAGIDERTIVPGMALPCPPRSDTGPSPQAEQLDMTAATSNEVPRPEPVSTPLRRPLARHLPVDDPTAEDQAPGWRESAAAPPYAAMQSHPMDAIVLASAEAQPFPRIEAPAPVPPPRGPTQAAPARRHMLPAAGKAIVEQDDSDCCPPAPEADENLEDEAPRSLPTPSHEAVMFASHRRAAAERRAQRPVAGAPPGPNPVDSEMPAVAPRGTQGTRQETRGDATPVGAPAADGKAGDGGDRMAAIRAIVARRGMQNDSSCPRNQEEGAVQSDDHLLTAQSTQTSRERHPSVPEADENLAPLVAASTMPAPSQEAPLSTSQDERKPQRKTMADIRRAAERRTQRPVAGSEPSPHDSEMAAMAHAGLGQDTRSDLIPSATPPPDAKAGEAGDRMAAIRAIAARRGPRHQDEAAIPSDQCTLTPRSARVC